MPRKKKELASPGLKEREEIQKSVEYNDDELKYRDYLIKRMETAKTHRDNRYPEFDDMDYNTYYEENSKAAYSYLREKENEEDTRIVTGTTAEKETTLLSSLLNYSFDSQITAFDENDFMINELGWTMADMVRKSRQIELYDAKKPLYYKEGLDQGTAFVEELWVEKNNIIKTLDENWGDNVSDLEKIKWTTKIEKVMGECQTRLQPGTKVFLGNVREFFIWEQPYVFIRDLLYYDDAKLNYGDWERWDFVKRKIVKFIPENNTINYRDWTLQETDQEVVEVIRYYDKPNNEFQIFLNGVMMLPIGFPLTAVSPSGEYPIAKLDVEALGKFWAYSKSVPAKMKVDQQVLDEFLRLMILKTQQSFKPPMVNNSNRALSRRIFLPGKITPGIGKGQLYSLIEGQQLGVTQGEFQAFELIKQLVNEKTINPVWSGTQTKSGTTATEVQELKKQQLMKLGWVVLGIMEFERQLSWLRIYNICANWTMPIDNRIDEYKKSLIKIYRSVNVKSNQEEEEYNRVIEFNPEKVNLTPEQIMAEEEILSMPGNKIKKTYVNPEILRTKKIYWFIEIVPIEKNVSELKKVLFNNTIREAQQLFGVNAPNYDYLKKRFAIMHEENPQLFFSQQQPINPMMTQAGQQQAKTYSDMVASRLGQSANTMTNKPNINQLTQNA